MGTMLSAVLIIGCGSGSAPEEGTKPSVPTATQVAADQDGGDSDAEHGASTEGGENGSKDNGEHGPGGEGSRESREAEMSSSIIPLSQSWTGLLGGLAVSMQYDEATRTVHGTVQNTLSEKLCYVQAEPHIKLGTKTVGELGPEKLGDLNPGQGTTSSLAIASEPKLAGFSYDGYVVHMEVYNCSGAGPSPHLEGEGPEGEGEHRRGGESAGEEGDSANALAPDETFDMDQSGARLILDYDAASNSFKGTVENTTEGVLERVRVEVHLSNGTELGPTTPTGMAPGELLRINLPATEESFTGWTAHVEVGSGEHGAGGESGGEHGRGSESGGEQDSEEESGDEHGSDGEHRNGD